MSTFSDLGIDAISGTEVVQELGVSVDEMQDNYTFNRLQDVMGYLNTLPEDMRLSMIKRVTIGKPVDNKLDHVWGYVKLRQRAEQEAKALDGTKKELSYYEE